MTRLYEGLVDVRRTYPCTELQSRVRQPLIRGPFLTAFAACRPSTGAQREGRMIIG
jgi:hypothetical protein